MEFTQFALRHEHKYTGQHNVAERGNMAHLALNVEEDTTGDTHSTNGEMNANKIM
jgi:hypothetical protein